MKFTKSEQEFLLSAIQRKKIETKEKMENTIGKPQTNELFYIIEDLIILSCKIKFIGIEVKDEIELEEYE